jgi:hypothetical protein
MNSSSGQVSVLSKLLHVVFAALPHNTPLGHFFPLLCLSHSTTQHGIHRSHIECVISLRFTHISQLSARSVSTLKLGAVIIIQTQRTWLSACRVCVVAASIRSHSAPSFTAVPLHSFCLYSPHPLSDHQAQASAHDGHPAHMNSTNTDSGDACVVHFTRASNNTEVNEVQTSAKEPHSVSTSSSHCPRST